MTRSYVAWHALALVGADFRQRMTTKPAATQNDEAELAAKRNRLRQQEEHDQAMRRVLDMTRQLKALMKNPTSFELVQTVQTIDGAMCFTYRATNSFGGVVPGRFVFVSNGDQFLVNDDSPRMSWEQWQKRCTGVLFKDYTASRMV